MTRKIVTEAQLIKQLRRKAFRRQHGLCFWCGEPMIEGASPKSDPRACTADHYPIPRHAGGQTRAGNIVAAHHSCNEGRHPEIKSIPGCGKGGVLYTTGDSTPRSPFEVLAGRVDG
jgi:hypothetical protein